MKSLLEAASRARALIEDNTTEFTPTARDAIRKLVDFALSACSPPETRPTPRGLHLIYMHPSNQRCVTFEPTDAWTPYYEWAHPRELSGWQLTNRHAWRDDALQIVAGHIEPPHTSRPPPSTPSLPSSPSSPSLPPEAPSGVVEIVAPGANAGPVEIMPLEEQIRRVLAAARRNGTYNGFMREAVALLRSEGFDLYDQAVLDAYFRVARGTSYPSRASSA